MTSQLIGLVGKKRVGKDTAAGFLVKDHGFVRYAFADPLKATMLDLDPWIPEGYDLSGGHAYERLSVVVAGVGWEAAKENGEVRRLLQAHGVAIRNHVDPDVWLRATMDKVVREDKPVVITDVRFPNEADAIEAAGGLLVRVVRAGAPNDDAHLSETALDSRECGALVVNDGSLESLRSAVWHLARV